MGCVAWKACEQQKVHLLSVCVTDVLMCPELQHIISIKK